MVLFCKDRATCPRVHAQFQQQVPAEAWDLRLMDTSAVYLGKCMYAWPGYGVRKAVSLAAIKQQIPYHA